MLGVLHDLTRRAILGIVMTKPEKVVPELCMSCQHLGEVEVMLTDFSAGLKSDVRNQTVRPTPLVGFRPSTLPFRHVCLPPLSAGRFTPVTSKAFVVPPLAGRWAAYQPPRRLRRPRLFGRRRPPSTLHISTPRSSFLCRCCTKTSWPLPAPRATTTTIGPRTSNFRHRLFYFTTGNQDRLHLVFHQR